MAVISRRRATALADHEKTGRCGMYTVDRETRSARVVSMKDIEAIRGTQEQLLAPVITEELTGAEQISAGVVFMPPARMSRAHLHSGTEIVVVCVRGFAATLLGPELTPVFHGPGE